MANHNTAGQIQWLASRCSRWGPAVTMGRIRAHERCVRKILLGIIANPAVDNNWTLGGSSLRFRHAPGESTHRDRVRRRPLRLVSCLYDQFCPAAGDPAPADDAEFDLTVIIRNRVESGESEFGQFPRCGWRANDGAYYGKVRGSGNDHGPSVPVVYLPGWHHARHLGRVSLCHKHVPLLQEGPDRDRQPKEGRTAVGW